jgi:hypothetical protein
MYAGLATEDRLMSTGYLYRIANADPERIRSLVDSTVQFPCGEVRGTLLWNIDTQPQLYSFARVSSAAELDLRGDLGHIFSAQAEVRWKRRNNGSYDVLLLTEQMQTLEGVTPLGGMWATRAISLQVRLRRNVQGNQQEPIALRAVEYCAANGAVQFIRYGEVQDELWQS